MDVCRGGIVDLLDKKMLNKSKNTKRVYEYSEERHAEGVCDRGGWYT